MLSTRRLPCLVGLSRRVERLLRSSSTGVARLSGWPRVDVLARARTPSILEVVAEHTKGVKDGERRATAIRDAARRRPGFWEGHLDFEALGWEEAELVADLVEGEERLERATVESQRRWQGLDGDDPLLLSVPGMGAKTASTVRALMGTATQFPSAKEAQAYVGLNPSNWSSGQMASASRGITKEGPSVLRLAFYQAANVARIRDPQQAEF
jgi:transposase